MGGPKVQSAPAPARVEAPPPTEGDTAAQDLYELLSDAVRDLDSGEQFALVTAFQNNQPWESAPSSVRTLITGVVRDFLE